jgi:hypothetical protein
VWELGLNKVVPDVIWLFLQEWGKLCYFLFIADMQGPSLV